MHADRRARGQGGGPDLAFAVNGSISRDTLPRSPGLRPNEALVLTHPLGIGILLATDGCELARACWMQAALRHTTLSNQAVAQVLAAHDANVAAYVAGLGLLRGWRRVAAHRIEAARHLVRDDGATSLTLLADPQVAGPLLAGVPTARADACVDALQAAG